MSSNPRPRRGASHVLPVALTPLLGRERELGEICALLEGTRLLTITGAGGSGKSRLALELAHRAAAGFDAAVWVDLAAIEEASLIPQQILSTLGARESPTWEAAELVVESLRARPHLLVLDNCEHVVDGCAALVETILRNAPQTKVVATSREALGIAGEQIWLVPPMSEADALQLFAERGRTVAPSFAIRDTNRDVVAHICQRLDGIPLAIELAAARVRMLTPEQIAARLDDVFPLLTSGSRTVARHRTIRETIDWSYRLLSAEEQRLFRRLSVFAGSFSLAAAEAICSSDGVEVLQHLGALVDKSLVVAGAGRYRLLETVRQFAAEKLSQSGEEDDLRERHARFFFTLVERSERRIYAGAVDPAALVAIDEEIDNIRRIFDWTAEREERSEVELRLLWALHWYWFARGHFHEARRRLLHGLGRARGVDDVVRARAIVAAGNAAVWQAEWESLRPSIDEAVAILRPTTNLRALANALLLLGCAHAFAEKDDDAAQAVFEEAEQVARTNGRNVALALTLFWAGTAAILRGDWAAARRAFEETYAIGLEQRNIPAMGHGATMLAQVALHEKKFAEAIHCLSTALEGHLQAGDRWGLIQAVEGVGLTLLELGDAEAGTRILAAASVAWLNLGARPGRRDTLEREKDQRIRQALGDEKLRRVLASGTALGHDEMVALASEHLDRLRRQPQTSASEDPLPPLAPARLRIRALGPLEIEQGGNRIATSSGSGRALELLLFLLSHPAGATKEEIGAALWPDADPAKLRNNFHVTVHRLRKILRGAEWVAADGEIYSLDRSAGVDFDAERFEQTVKGALRVGDTAALETAIALYGGDFGQQVAAGEWLLPIRDRFRDLHAEALRIVGRSRMAAEDFAGAAAAYQKLIELDDLDEQAYRNLMTCLGRLDDRGGVSRVYRRLTDVLRRELQTAPDPATTRLHARLTEASPA